MPFNIVPCGHGAQSLFQLIAEVKGPVAQKQPERLCARPGSGKIAAGAVLTEED